MKFTFNKDTALSIDVIEKVLEKNKTAVANYKKLADYYCGKHDILNRTVKDAAKPNHKIVNPFPQYITDTLVGYFVGEAITYTANDENIDAELNAINNINNVSSIDSDLAKALSIYGKAYELHYIDESGNPRFCKINPDNVVIIYDDSIEAQILYAIRIVPQYDIIKDETTYRIEVYDDAVIKTYAADQNMTSLSFVDEQPHYYGIVPIVEYANNEQEIGDYETIIPLIDAYDILESDALNDFDYFVDAYLMLTGMTADSEDIAAMKENRVILLDDANSKAEWLIKSENDTVSENLKNRYKNDIHKFAKVPDLSDEAFSNNASGVAIKYKLWGTETLVANKERYFRKGIDRRLELLFNILNIKGSSADWRAVEVQFTRNLPTNETEIADVVQKLSGIVSTSTLLSQIPFVTDVAAELEKLEEDKANNPFYAFDADKVVDEIE